MQLQGSRADPAQLERLQSMLSEKNSEIHNLMTKLQRLEKVEVSSSTPEDMSLHVLDPKGHVCLCPDVTEVPAHKRRLGRRRRQSG